MIVDALKDRDVVVGTTGMLSRELFEYRVAKGHGHEKDFLTVGSMGHASAIALGIAQFRPKRQVLTLYHWQKVDSKAVSISNFVETTVFRGKNHSQSLVY